MSIITYEKIARTAETTAVPRAKREGFWTRLYDKLIEARQKAAMAELRRHAVLLPRELEQAGWKVNERSEDSLPFVR